mmetsp:Transcript_27351/g.79278  ORF Transcript_27351/g.79278 Transcript_27351/m.79278 type:complete len:273 (+) Transcript_27351:357-1175(+)
MTPVNICRLPSVSSALSLSNAIGCRNTCSSSSLACQEVRRICSKMLTASRYTDGSKPSSCHCCIKAVSISMSPCATQSSILVIKFSSINALYPCSTMSSPASTLLASSSERWMVLIRRCRPVIASFKFFPAMTCTSLRLPSSSSDEGTPHSSAKRIAAGNACNWTVLRFMFMVLFNRILPQMRLSSSAINRATLSPGKSSRPNSCALERSERMASKSLFSTACSISWCSSAWFMSFRCGTKSSSLTPNVGTWPKTYTKRLREEQDSARLALL